MEKAKEMGNVRTITYRDMLKGLLPEEESCKWSKSR